MTWEPQLVVVYELIVLALSSPVLKQQGLISCFIFHKSCMNPIEYTDTP